DQLPENRVLALEVVEEPAVEAGLADCLLRARYPFIHGGNSRTGRPARTARTAAAVPCTRAAHAGPAPRGTRRRRPVRRPPRGCRARCRRTPSAGPRRAAG